MQFQDHFFQIGFIGLIIEKLHEVFPILYKQIVVLKQEKIKCYEL